MLKPYYEADGIVLYHADCRDVLPELDADVLITDPPYGMINAFGPSTHNGNRTRSFDMDKGGEAIHDVLESLTLIMPKIRSFHLFCDPEHYGKIAGVARKAELTPKPWIKVKTCPPPPLTNNWWPSGFEMAMYGYRDRAYFNDQTAKRVNVHYADSYRYGIRRDEKVKHPTQKWLPMIEYLVQTLVAPDAVVIDPFAGSGTTLRAAKNLQRRSIGIEIHEPYCELIATRLAQKVMAL